MRREFYAFDLYAEGIRICRGSVLSNHIITQLDAVIISPAKQDLGELGGSYGVVFIKINTWNQSTRVKIIMAEGQVTMTKSFVINKEV